MQNIYLKKLILENYRNFSYFEIDASLCPIMIIGENGSGKTNILESISLCFPGRGLRNTKFEEICKSGQDSWISSILFQSKLGLARVSNQFKMNSGRRVIEFNGVKITNNELCNFVNMIWLTPQMENIFCEGASSRRKFFDRIVCNFFLDHASKLNEYEYYISQRLGLLQHNAPDENWLDILEEKIAKVSSIIIVNRLDTLLKMQAAIDDLVSEFPKAILSLEGEIESIYHNQEEDDIIEYIKQNFRNTRLKDKFSNRTSFGVHRSDFLAIHSEKNMPIKLCSTGEQKAILISITIAQINAYLQIAKIAPILLLDEIFVHLDDRRREYLIDFLINTKLQVWITATDCRGIEKLIDYSKIIYLEQ